MLQYAGSPITFGVEADRSVFDYARMRLEDDMGLTLEAKQYLEKEMREFMLNNIATNADLRMAVILRAIVNDDAKAAQILGVTPADIAKAVADEQARRLQA